MHLCRRMDQGRDTVSGCIGQPGEIRRMRRMNRQTRHNNRSAEYKVDGVQLAFHVVLPFQKPQNKGQ